MPYVIAQPCVGVKDAACVAVCPVDVIHPTKDEAGFDQADQLFIDARGCINCDLCVSECPVDAIFSDADLPIAWNEYLEKNAAYYRDR
jgi:ferredoxin